jgi:uncharacterized membrane protein YdcZ (DUF606 family)
MAVGTGAAISIVLPVTSRSARIAGAPVTGNIRRFAMAFATPVMIAPAAGQRGEALGRIARVPASLVRGGLVEAVMIPGASCLVPWIGTSALFVQVVTGQVRAGA